MRSGEITDRSYKALQRAAKTGSRLRGRRPHEMMVNFALSLSRNWYFRRMTKRISIRAIDPSEQSELPSEPAEATGIASSRETEDAEPSVPWLMEDTSWRSAASLSTTIWRLLATVVVVAWTAAFVWSHWAVFDARTSPSLWTALAANWATPVILVVGLWLLAQRNSTREAARFGALARGLADEAGALEIRLAAINRELSLAREFLTAQSRELEYLGRSASDRISENASALQGLIHDNSRQVDAIATVSVTALENMVRLRDQLPVVANSARDVTNQIGAAARTAQSGLSDLVSGFERLNDFGSASERQVASLRAQIDDAMTAFGEQADHLQALADERFARLRAESEAFRGELDNREVDALAAVQARAEKLRIAMADTQAQAEESHRMAAAALEERIAELGREANRVSDALRDGEQVAVGLWRGQIDGIESQLRTALQELSALDQEALDAAHAKLRALVSEAEGVDLRLAERNQRFDRELTERRALIARQEEEALATLGARLAMLDEAIAQRRESQGKQLAAFEQQSAALAEQVRQFGEVFERAASQGREAQGATTQSIDSLAAKLVETREALDGTDMAVAALTDGSVRLLELIQASARHSREDLPNAMQGAENRLAEMETRALALRETMAVVTHSGNDLLQTLQQTVSLGDTASPDIESLRERIDTLVASQREAIAVLRADLLGFGSEAEIVAGRSQEELRAALASLEESAATAIASLETGQAEQVAAIARSIADGSRTALTEALTQETTRLLAEVEAATQRSSEASRATVIQLRDQLARVNDLAGNLEARVAQARERAEEQIDSDFSRRVALISESLNSNAIDITKALSSEVTDTAWASYLRGDRGVFTRRAVRLLDNTEARDIALLYDADREFRDHVSRFIHDFEAMLRTILSTRDGHAISVTLLSSDLGKLYVALAQALERLRN